VRATQDGGVAIHDSSSGTTRERAVWIAGVTLFAIVPLAVVLAHIADVIITDSVPYDFRVYYDAADVFLDGGSPYVSLAETLAVGGYVYPPFTALVVAPLTVLDIQVAGVLVLGLLILATLAIPYVLGVRDWRCFGLLLLWPPVIQGLQTGNATIVMALLAALAWRFRDRAALAGLALGTAFAVKLMLWPLAVWLAATRRYRAVAWMAGSALLLVLVPWAAVDFVGLREYPTLLREFGEALDDNAYSLYAVALDLGAGSAVARAVWAVAAIALLTATVVMARRRDEPTAFVLAIAATLSVSPIVWLPYFLMLAVAVAVAQPHLGVLWFAPLAMWGVPGTYDPGSIETVATVAIAAVTLALAVRITSHTGRQNVGTAPATVAMEPAR